MKTPSRTTIRLVLEAHDPKMTERYNALSRALADLLERLAQLEAVVELLQASVVKLEEPELPFAPVQPRFEKPPPNGT